MTRLVPPSVPRSYGRLIADLGAVLTIVLGLLLTTTRRPPAEPTPMARTQAAPKPAPTTVSKPRPTPPEPPPAAPRPPEPDRAAIARAEADLEEARRARRLAEARAEAAGEALRRAGLDAASATVATRALGARLPDPRARLTSARTQGAAVKAEADRLAAEVAALAEAPLPRRESLLGEQTPVARPVEETEYHFEVRGDRVAFIDLERLIERLEADARLQIRLSGGDGRAISSTVGPVGDFSLSYELGQPLPAAMADLFNLRGGRYDLLGWEVVPARKIRGETLATIAHPASEFARVINSLNPAQATITLWVYPDGFGLYRALASRLHALGFQVAARPLPEGLAIRGSPSGSLSAGQ